MEFNNIPVSVQPAYTWLWNTQITKEGIKAQIDEMFESGIRAFYVLGEPENFLPNRRRTHLSPEYLSDEYLDLLYYAFEVAKSKGMYMWLYNEGGFPSGMVCGKIREKYPELAKKYLNTKKQVYSKNDIAKFEDNVIAAFANGARIKEGHVFDAETEVIKYYHYDEEDGIYTDIAAPDTLKRFIDMTHKKLKERFGGNIGSDINFMFDDESSMGSWTYGLEEIFKNKYGYDIEDYMPCISLSKEPSDEKEFQAMSDYFMLCGELVLNNYFSPMKKWLNDNNMLSVGHLNTDHTAKGSVINYYGNALKILREFDVPGVDVIWNQIIYPEKSKVCKDGMDFFPRLASSAARHNGHSKCLSESLAVYGAHVDQELMRYVVNYQAVRGISLFNFMVISYDRKSARVHQYRPNFVKENPCMDHLKEINDYSARISYILQNSSADIKTALYCPARSICACGKMGNSALKSFEELGESLEKAGVSFDIIDEDIVLNSEIKNGALLYNGLVYENVFVPECDLELNTVKDRLKMINHNLVPCVERTNSLIQARKLIFDDGEGYFICNTSGNTVNDTVKIQSDKTPYMIDLTNGEICGISFNKKGMEYEFDISLLRGEAMLLYFTDKEVDLKSVSKEFVCELKDFESFVSREYKVDAKENIINTYYSSGKTKNGFYEWDKDFSGEVTYTLNLGSLDSGEYEIDLGDVKSIADVYIDEKIVGTAVHPPYKIRFRIEDKTEKKLKIVVCNTAAKVCRTSDYFDNQDILDVGPYHENMVIAEEKYGCGGFYGPVILSKIL